MTDNLLVRRLPPQLYEWIREESHSQRKTQNEFVLQVLESACHYGVQPELFDILPKEPISVPPADLRLPFRFIDLFAGIGGFRFAMQALGGTCVFTSEWDRDAQKTYAAWHSGDIRGDITKIDIGEIPDHDILCAGFPCQPFSLAGVSKKRSLGRRHGFEDETQGTLFFHIARIAEAKRPPVLILENVKNLASHDKGNTWRVIERTLRDLDYVVVSKVIDARPWVPQHRERIFIVCFDEHVFGHHSQLPFSFPVPPSNVPVLRDILDPNPPEKYTLSDHLWDYLQRYAEKHRKAGNGFGFGIADPDGCARTLSARYHKDGSEILVAQKGRNPRRLTPAECGRLMGYPEGLPQVVSDTQAYRQFGNSVVPAVVQAVGRQILEVLTWHIAKSGTLLKPSPAEIGKMALVG